MTVKPHAGVFWLGAAALAGWGAWRGDRSPLAAPGTVLAAALVAPALVFGWLGWRGGLGPFVAVFTGYVVPLYSHVGRVPLWQPFGDYRFGWALWGLLAILALLGLSTPAPGVEARKAVAALGVDLGRAPLRAPGQGLGVPALPARRFSVCACALRAPPTERRGLGAPRAPVDAGAVPRPPARGRARALRRHRHGARRQGCGRAREPWIADKARRVAALTRDLAPRVPPGGTVQVMDVTEGGVHALWSLRLRQPTRFIYDFHFFHDTGDSRIVALREEFVAGLAGQRPCRHRGAARHLEPPRLRAARGLARGRAAARALVYPRRRGRRLPDLCQAR